jgi:HEAT repeat protein
MRGTFGLGLLGLALLAAPGATLAQRAPKKPPVQADAGPTYEGKTLAEWLKEMKHQDASRRSGALVAVMQFDLTQASNLQKQSLVKGLLDRIPDRDISPRAKALLALRFIDVPPDEVNAIVKALGARIDPTNPYGETQATVRYEAARTLARFVADAFQVIPQLVRGSQDRSSWEIRHQCVTILWRAAKGKNGPDPDAIKGMLDLLQTETTFSVRAELLNGLAALGKPTNNPALLARELSLLRTCAQPPRNPDNRPLMLWALVALVSVGDGGPDGAASLNRLAKYVTNEKESLLMRSQAAQALGSLGDRGRNKVPTLLAVIDDKESMLSSSACMGLSGIGDSSDRVVDALLRTMAHKDSMRAASAVKALVDLNLYGNVRVIGAMDKLREDKNLDLRLRAYIEEAIKTLKGPKPKNLNR